MSYTTTQRVRHEGKVYQPGAPIELHEDEAALLGAAVKAEEKPQVEEKPATQASTKAPAKKPAASKKEA